MYRGKMLIAHDIKNLRKLWNIFTAELSNYFQQVDLFWFIFADIYKFRKFPDTVQKSPDVSMIFPILNIYMAFSINSTDDRPGPCFLNDGNDIEHFSAKNVSYLDLF